MDSVNNTAGAMLSLSSSTVGSGSGNIATISGSSSASEAIVNCPLNFIGEANASWDSSVFSNPIIFSDDSKVQVYNSRISTGATQPLIMNSSQDCLIANVIVETSAIPAMGGSGSGTLVYETITLIGDSEILGLAALVESSVISSQEMTAGGLFLCQTLETDNEDEAITIENNTISSIGDLVDVDINIIPQGTGDLNLINGNLDVDTGNLNVLEGNANIEGGHVNVTLGNANIVTGNLNVMLGDGNIVAGDINVTAGDANIVAGDVNVDAGDVQVDVGDVIISGAGSKIQMKGGAATDFIGEVTLVDGVATVLNTNISASDHIFLTRISFNDSLKAGAIVYSIDDGVSFTVMAVKTTSGNIEDKEESTISYVIIRQI